MTQRGLSCKLYYDDTGAGVGEWAELDRVDDVTINDSAEAADMTSRAGGGVKEELNTITAYEVTFNLLWKRDDPGCVALFEANKNKSTIGIAAMDGDVATAGNMGLQADCQVFGFNMTQPLRDGVKVAVTLRPTVSSFSHGWKTITV